jgi:hypothetical protein
MIFGAEDEEVQEMSILLLDIDIKNGSRVF